MITGTHILAIAEALANKAGTSSVDWVIPSPIRYADKAAFFTAYDDSHDTQTEIETTLINAAWLRYLNFELETGDSTGMDPREVEAPLITLIYEGTLFSESTDERLDETLTPDDFNKQIRRANHEHVTQIFELQGEFQGTDPVTALTPSSFSEASTVGIVQSENSETDVECSFVGGAFGDQTKFEIRIKVQNPC